MVYSVADYDDLVSFCEEAASGSRYANFGDDSVDKKYRIVGETA